MTSRVIFPTPGPGLSRSDIGLNSIVNVSLSVVRTTGGESSAVGINVSEVQKRVFTLTTLNGAWHISLRCLIVRHNITLTLVPQIPHSHLANSQGNIGD